MSSLMTPNLLARLLLSNRQIYEFQEAEVRKIIEALLFASPKDKYEAKFKLD